ncbi:PAS domain-containing sensor histidine kinase [Halosimplex pelagicum]|uniref:histidine kinase n=1 Tax=Halosimplex pelagicum TaxID=869886 RepID=A0A7D5PDK8_9EURY|nr:PAS domain-containing sensor histidine kinase [Halosimplex pelagicum]QLH80339.1 PAS domain-containing protein [Halosimplex pelagicum]
MADSHGDDGRPEGDESALVAAAFDALPAQVAVVDAEGVILTTNRAWRQFGLDNDMQGGSDMVGENYLAVCDASDDESATEAAAGIRSVLASERAEFTLEYPCHSPDERRWFLMRAIDLSEYDDPHALVMHVDITDRKEAELRVKANNETLSTVASVLSHDLRNPLNVAMGRTDQLAEDPGADAETVADGAASILSSLERMNAIVDDAVVLARGADTVETERVRLGAAAREAWSHVETGDASLAVRDDATVVADASLLAQLLENLFGNSLDHGGGGAVTVGATADGFFVADDGPGVAAADRERVFDAGYSTRNADDNTGMGLAIVRKIAEAHGWTVRLTDARAPTDGASRGARFEFAGVELDR